MTEENKKEYEISCLLTSPEAETTLIKTLRDHGAEVFYQKPATELRLAYKINKHTAALFGFYHFRTEPANIDPLEKNLRLNTGVLRFLIITPPIKLASAPAPRLEKEKERKPAAPILSNEALSERLEEILK